VGSAAGLRTLPARRTAHAPGADTIKIGDNNVEYAYGPARTRIKAGTTVTFTNVGDLLTMPAALQQSEWSTGTLAKGESKTVSF